MISPPLIRDLGCRDYQLTWQQMKEFTDTRDSTTTDEIWFLEHPSVFTQGLAGKPEHVLNPGDIPIVQTDRGGQVTYHGPGQIVVYVLFDLRRLNIGIRQFVRNLEHCVINVLAEYRISAANRFDAPGVYVDGAKICSIGLRVRKGCSYHGIAFNVDMALEPFTRINPCGFRNLPITQVRHFIDSPNHAEIKSKISRHLCLIFGYNASFYSQTI